MQIHAEEILTNTSGHEVKNSEVVQQTPEEKYFFAEAEKLGLQFNGFQKHKNEFFPMFTGKNVGTFVIERGETLVDAYRRKKKQFGI